MFWISIKDLEPTVGMVVLGMIKGPAGEEVGPIVAMWRKTPHVPLYGWHPYWCLDPENDDMIELSMYMLIPQ